MLRSNFSSCLRVSLRSLRVKNLLLKTYPGEASEDGSSFSLISGFLNLIFHSQSKIQNQQSSTIIRQSNLITRRFPLFLFPFTDQQSSIDIRQSNLYPRALGVLAFYFNFEF